MLDDRYQVVGRVKPDKTIYREGEEFGRMIGYNRFRRREEHTSWVSEDLHHGMRDAKSSREDKRCRGFHMLNNLSVLFLFFFANVYLLWLVLLEWTNSY